MPPKCEMVRTEVTVSGTVNYAEYRAGPIDIQISEHHSSVCIEGANGYQLMDPGEGLAQLVINEPGRFEESVTVSFVKGAAPPNIDISVYHRSADDTSNCLAGGIETVAMDAAADVDISLIHGDCPIRI